MRFQTFFSGAMRLTVGLLLTTSASARASDVDVTDWLLATQARDTFPSPFVSVIDETVRFPFTEVHTATDGLTTAQTTYDFHLSEHSASFDFLFEHSRSGSDASRAEGGGRIDFVLTGALEYSVAGSFSLSGARRIRLDVSVMDLSVYPEQFVYRGWHESTMTAGESFALGMAGGDLISEEVGDLSGALSAGTPYKLSYHYLIENYPAGSADPASAVGTLNFTLVPEPSALIILGVGGLILMRRRR